MAEPETVFLNNDARPPGESAKRMIPKASRERGGLLQSLARFVGLLALVEAIGRTAPFRSRSDRVRTVTLAVSLVAGVAVVGLLLPWSRPSVVTVITSPGRVITLLRGGSATQDLTKGYPRIYSVKLGIDLAIRPGDGGLRPPVEAIAFQYPTSAPLGETGNTYLYAHDRPGMFLGLHKAVVGDVVVVAVSASKKMYYQVTEIHSNVAWNDLRWLQPSSDARLTLQTCNYSGDYDPRYVVVTKPISPDTGRQLVGDI